MSDLGQRVASAVVLGPLVLLVVWWGNPSFAALVALGAGAIVWEWGRITCAGLTDGATPIAATGVGLAVLAVAFQQWGIAAILIVAAAAGSQALSWRGGDRLLWVGALYAALPAVLLVMLRDDAEWGRAAVFWLLFLVWATDIGAYFAGRLIGGAKLWPAVSPKKTWSGAAGGIAAALVVGLASLYFLVPGAEAPWALLGLIVGLSMAAQLGDLAESALKRRFGVKDSSNLIPGHGGVMDRVDGLVAAGLVAGFIGAARAGPDAAGGGLLLW